MATLVLALASHAQAEEKKVSEDDRIFTVVVENDSIGFRGTDQHYTSGVRLGYLDRGFEIPEIAHEIASYIPTFSLNKDSAIFYSLGQNLYSPSTITERPQDPGGIRAWPF